MPDLTTPEVKKLLAFRGYGNPSGRFWFVGMEEGGGDFESLQIRADEFANLEDIATSPAKFESHDMSKSISTWRIMSAIVGRISGTENWWETACTTNYQMNRLGRLNDETYLTEILPLPKRSLSDWPYGNFFDSPKSYFEQIFPAQLASLRLEYSESKSKPEFVFCYGKKYWPFHKKIFESIDFESALDDRILWGQNHSTIFVLTNFFGYGWTGFGENFVEKLCQFVLSKS